MSSDYRPRSGGSSSSGGSNGGPRRRRGGRGRGGPGGRPESSGAPRSFGNGSTPNGTNGSTASPKKQGPIAAFFSWITGGNKKPANGRPAYTENRPPVDRPRNPRPERTERTDRPERADRPERSERPPRAERPPREERPEPELQEIVSPKLYVGNLAYEAAESDLFDLFSKIGAVKNVEVAMDRRANRSKGFGFVEMEVLETAKEAAEKLNRTDFMGRQIVVSGAKMERSRVNPREESAEPEGESSSASSSEEGII